MIDLEDSCILRRFASLPADLEEMLARPKAEVQCEKKPYVKLRFISQPHDDVVAHQLIETVGELAVWLLCAREDDQTYLIYTSGVGANHDHPVNAEYQRLVDEVFADYAKLKSAEKALEALAE